MNLCYSGMLEQLSLLTWSSTDCFRDDPALVDTALVNAASVKNVVYLWIYTIHTIKRHILMI
jgi:hypothetical protein